MIRFFACALTALCLASSPIVATAAAESWPKPIQALADRGIQIVKQFDAPGDLTGYAARVGPRWLAVYLLPDGKHAILGTLLDAQGNALTDQALQRIQQAYQASLGPVWPRLQDSTWVADGSDQAERVVYMFTDPNCPYCHQFWQMARPWVESGQVQLRHIIIGIIKPSSPGKAAAILTAENSSKALARNQRGFEDGGIAPVESVSPKIRNKLQANLLLMQQLNLYGTPAILYRGHDGEIHTKQGLPARPQQLEAILGKRD